MKNAESFDLIWLEQPQEWLVLFPDGSSLLGAFGSRGMALNAALRYLDRLESEFMVTRDDGDFCRYERAPEYWRSETDRARAYKPEDVSLLVDGKPVVDGRPVLVIDEVPSLMARLDGIAGRPMSAATLMLISGLQVEIRIAIIAAGRETPEQTAALAKLDGYAAQFRNLGGAC